MNEQLMENVLSAVRTCDVDHLPRVLGMLAEISETCRARLSAPAPAPATDELLSCAEAAKLLHCSKDTLYRGDFPFVRRLGRKRLYSSAGIAAYLQRQH
jgi:Helix-turn-helix domain